MKKNENICFGFLGVYDIIIKLKKKQLFFGIRNLGC